MNYVSFRLKLNLQALSASQAHMNGLKFHVDTQINILAHATHNSIAQFRMRNVKIATINVQRRHGTRTHAHTRSHRWNGVRGAQAHAQQSCQRQRWHVCVCVFGTIRAAERWKLSHILSISC